MPSKTKARNVEMISSYYVARLTVNDIPALQPLEEQVKLAFWGKDNYRRFLEEYPEYFGCKAALNTVLNGEMIVGFFLARSIYDNLEILKLGVLPEYHRQRIGTELMENAYSEGVRRGCSRCFLEVRKSNQTAIQFYYRHHFRIAGTRLDYYTDPVEDAWIMERTL